MPLGTEFVDWAAKGTGEPFMTAVTFGYGTVMSDTTAGGPGAALDLPFYTGTGGGGCILGSEIGRIIFTGLPGATASIPPGFGATYNVTIIFGGIQVSVGPLSNPIPKDQGLEGLSVCVQAAEFNGPGNFGLTNAQDCVLGG